MQVQESRRRRRGDPCPTPRGRASSQPPPAFIMTDASFSFALTIAATWTFLVSLTAGMLLVRSQTARGPPHPFVSAAVSGLLIGISCLVVLPEALDQLPAAGWTSSQVLVLFLAAAAVMFFLDHSCMEHTHVGRGERLQAAPEPVETAEPRIDPPSIKEWEDGAAVCTAITTEVGRRPTPLGDDEGEEVVGATPTTAEVMARDGEFTINMDVCEVACAPAKTTGPLPHAPVAWCPCHGGDPFAKGGNNVISFNPMADVMRWRSQGMVSCPAGRPMATMKKEREPSPSTSSPSDSSRDSPSSTSPPRALSPPPSPPAIEPDNAIEEGYATRKTKRGELLKQSADGEAPMAPPLLLSSSGCSRLSSVAIRVTAWMLHAMVDGMVLASATSTYVLIATAVPVTICALQDVAAFTVTMARLGYDSRRSLQAAVIALSCAFPLGALVSHAVFESATSETAVNVVRTLVAGVFTYMALFELAPPHTHSRLANTCYLLCFVGGAALAYLVDIVEVVSMAGEGPRMVQS